MRSKPSKPPTTQTPPPATDTPTPATALSRSVIHRRLPLALRARLDEAILLRPKALPTLEAIAAHFDLARYRISPQALRAYSRRLEDLARPAATGQLLAVVLGCLPPSYRRRVHDGTEVLLLSRMAQALSGDGTQALSVAELARLGPVVVAMARAHRPRESASAKQSQFRRLGSTRKTIQASAVKTLVRGVYDVQLNLSNSPPPNTPEPTPEAKA